MWGLSCTFAVEIFERMKIGYDGKRAVQNATGLGNYSRYVVESLSAFAPENEYWLYAPSPRKNRQLSLLVEESKGLVSIHYPSSCLWKSMRALWRIGGIWKDLQRDEIELFHGLSNELPFTIRKARKVKSVVTVHDLIFLKLPHCFSPIDRWIYNQKCRYACRHADHIIAVSECTKRDIIRYYGISESKISVIYQGCNPIFSSSVPVDKRWEVACCYHLPKRYILSVGTIEERKNALTLVQALAHLPKELHLVLVGRPTVYTLKVKDFIHKAGLQERVHFLHGVSSDDLPAIYQCAESFVYPSVYEGFGIPVLEALHSGIPVVAATGSCLEEAGGAHSLYVAPYDVEALAAAIQKTSVPSVRAAMIEEGRKWAKRFTPEQMAHDTMTCYRKVCGAID